AGDGGGEVGGGGQGEARFAAVRGGLEAGVAVEVEITLETGLLTVAVGPGRLDRAHGLDVGRVAAHSGVAVAAGRGRGQVSLTAIGRVGVAVVETGVADAGTVDAHRVCTTGRIARGGVRRVRIRC